MSPTHKPNSTYTWLLIWQRPLSKEPCQQAWGAIHIISMSLREARIPESGWKTKKVCSSYANCCHSPTKDGAAKNSRRQSSGWGISQLPPPTLSSLPAPRERATASPPKTAGKTTLNAPEPLAEDVGLKDLEASYPGSPNLKFLWNTAF